MASPWYVLSPEGAAWVGWRLRPASSGVPPEEAPRGGPRLFPRPRMRNKGDAPGVESETLSPAARMTTLPATLLPLRPKKGPPLHKGAGVMGEATSTPTVEIP